MLKLLRPISGRELMLCVLRSLLTGVLAISLLQAGAAHADEAQMKAAGCTACHRVDQKLIGPAFNDVAKKYRADKAAAQKLFDKVREGGEGVWGDVPMPGRDEDRLSDEDLQALIDWILKL